MRIYKYKFLLYVLSSCLIFYGCAKNNATGERQLVILSQAEENDIGAKEHPNIIKNFGGIYDNQILK